LYRIYQRWPLETLEFKKKYKKRIPLLGTNQNGNISRVMHEQPVECAPARSKGPS